MGCMQSRKRAATAWFPSWLDRCSHPLSSKLRFSGAVCSGDTRIHCVDDCSGLARWCFGQPRAVEARGNLFSFLLKGIDFVDALVVVKMRQKGITTLVSFDHDYDDFPFIMREEP